MQTGNRCKSKAIVGKQKQHPCGYKTTSLVAQHTLESTKAVTIHWT